MARKLNNESKVGLGLALSPQPCKSLFVCPGWVWDKVDFYRPILLCRLSHQPKVVIVQ